MSSSIVRALRLLAGALLAVTLSTSGGCVSYDVSRSRDPQPDMSITGIAVKNARATPTKDDLVEIGDLELVRKETYFVSEEETDFDVEPVAMGWYMNDGPFPAFRSVIEDVVPVADYNDVVDEGGIFGLFIGVPVLLMIDLGILTGSFAVDAVMMTGTLAVDAVSGVVSAPVMLPAGAVAGIDPSPRSEVYETGDRTSTVEGKKVLCRIELPGDDKPLSVVSGPGGAIVVPMPNAMLEKALLTGAHPLKCRVQVEGATGEATFDIPRGSLFRALAQRIEGGTTDPKGRIDAWRALYAKLPEKEGDSRTDVQQRLLELGFVAGAGDNDAYARLVEKGGGVADLSDGVTVDWSDGKPTTGAPRAEVELGFKGGLGTITAGTETELIVTVRNTGKGPLFRLFAETRSGLQEANLLKVLFGRVNPGQTITRRVKVPTAITRPAQAATIELTFSELNEYHPAPVTGQFRIEAAPRPRLITSSQVVDDVGNGDGIVQVGESFDLRVGIRNEGNANAEDVRVEITVSASGVDVFGDPIQNLGTMKPGEIKSAVLNVALKPSFRGSSVPITARITEHSPFEVTIEPDLTLAVNAKAAEKVAAIELVVYVVKDQTTLFSGASDTSSSVGAIDRGAQRAVGLLGDFYQIAFKSSDGQVKKAWLRRADVTTELPAALAQKPKPGAQEPQAAGAVVREFANTPPVVSLFRPEVVSPQTPVDTGEESIKLEAVALDPGGLDKVVILLNGKELPDEGGTRGVGGVKRAPSQAAASSAVTQLRVSRDIPLQVGDNKIEVIARDGAGASSKVEVLVRRTVQGGNVYALVVGINSYNDAQGIPALRYAEADATAVADFLKTDPKSPVKDPANVQVLLGAQATKKNIMKALETHILGKATYPRDMAIFYFAGHGFSKGQSYLLASVDTEYDSLLATGIKREDIQAIWGSIAAEQKLFVADACHSGGLKDVRGDNEINSGLSTLTQAKGSVTLLAAGEKQKSHESEKLKHGIFTHVLVEGMKGAADQVSGNRDGRVNVTELASYVKTTVPAMALQEHGAHQDPIVNFVGMDGELVISKPKSK